MDVGYSAPIKQHPYRVSPIKKELLDKEVQYMLKNDIIEASQSNWSSPCILVIKHDGGFRFSDSREISAFVTPSGLYQYKVMPFGMKNAPATFQRMVYMLVRDIDGCEGYIDDVVIFSDNWSDHICQIKHFFQIM